MTPDSQRDQTPAPKARIASVDALRGFDMMWIAGGDKIFRSLGEASPSNGFLAMLAQQCDHVGWAGFRFYDLIFPLFVFIAGVSIVLSLGKMMERIGKRAAIVRVIKRGVTLFALGVIYNGGFSKPWPDVRLLGVLSRIALCYLFTGLLFCNFKLRGLIVSLVLILGGYWLLMSFVPMPGQSAVSFEQDHNVTNWVDLHYLPGKLYDGTCDPEGLLSTIPAVGTCLLGVFAGMLLISEKVRKDRKALYLLGAGVGMVALGLLWGVQFPVIKKLWTSSYVLVAGGYSAILLGSFYYLIDIRGWRRWATPFMWIGANAIGVYFLRNVVRLSDLANCFVGGSIALAVAPYSKTLTAAVAMLFCFLFARFLYKREIFLRL